MHHSAHCCADSCCLRLAACITSNEDRLTLPLHSSLAFTSGLHRREHELRHCQPTRWAPRVRTKTWPGLACAAKPGAAHVAGGQALDG